MATTRSTARTAAATRTAGPAVRTLSAAPTGVPAPVVLPVAAVAPAPPAPAARSSRPGRRPGRAARPVVPVALGSLTQPGARIGGDCARCGSPRVTSLTLMLTDGTPVEFTSCHTCEHRTWVGPDGPLDRQTVLDRTRKVR